MCSIFKYKNLVGRNFDYEISYKEELITIPKMEYDNKYAIIGVCTGAVTDYPLLYDGMNEAGLCCGGLAFSKNAKYYTYKENLQNIPAYDFTFQVLKNHKTVKEVKEWLQNVNIWCEPYSEQLSNSDLHWFIADPEEAIIVEQTEEGLNIYDGEVMTNNPPYPVQKDIADFGNSLVGDCAVNYIDNDIWYSRGRETDGLAGGYSSDERFERLTYLKENLEKNYKDDNPFYKVINTFHLLSSVEQIIGLTPVETQYEYTIYSIVYDMETKKVWVKTYYHLCPMNYLIAGSERIPL